MIVKLEILLDAKMNPKISDFGMAHIFKGDQNQDKTTRVVRSRNIVSIKHMPTNTHTEKLKRHAIIKITF